MATQNRFYEKACGVAVSNNYDTCGTITRSSIKYFTPQEVQDLYKPGNVYGAMTDLLRTQIEMQTCGIKRSVLWDWFLSSLKKIDPKLQNVTHVDRGPSLLQPFILGRQDSVVNNDTWAITAGQANSAYTALVTGPLTSAQKSLGAAGDRVVRLVSRYGIELDAGWFVDKDRIYIFGRSNGEMSQGQWKVLASAAASDATYVDVLITSKNTGTAPFDAAPTSGVVIKGGARVNDFESWCHNRPTLDPRKRVPFWIETVRRTRCVDSQYREFYAKMMSDTGNEWFKAFGDLPLAERNRQDEVNYQRERLNAFFWGKAASSNQTLTLWQNLPQITTVTGSQIDPGTGGKLVAYEAYAVGVMEQLRACDRVRGLGNQPLNLYEFWDELYNIKRARQSQGKPSNSIDMWTDSRTAANFETGFVNYAKAEWGDIIRVNITADSAELGFHYKSYEPKFPQGVKLNVLTDEYFDDWVSAMDAESIASSGRMMLLLDWGKDGPNGGTIYPAAVASNSKMRTLGELEGLARLDPTFACTMENITQEIMLHSDTSTSVVSCPANSLAIVSIADAVPKVTGRTAGSGVGTYGDLYTLPWALLALGASILTSAVGSLLC